MPIPADPMWSAAQVAALFGVDSKSVVRWAEAELLPVVRTPGGHRRYPESKVRALFEAGGGVWPGDAASR